MYRIVREALVNVGPFADVSVNLDMPGLTVVEGFMPKTGFTSNGSGKSFLLVDGPTWILFDRCMRAGYGGDDIIRMGSTGGAMGTLELEDPKGRRVRVVRYRKHPTGKNTVRLFVDDKDVTRGTNPETNKAIVDELGMDFTAYVNSVAFAAREDVAGFFYASDADRKAILERVMGLEEYGSAMLVAKEDAKRITGELDAARSDMESAEADLAAAEAHRYGICSQFDEKTAQRAVKASADALESHLRKVIDSKRQHAMLVQKHGLAEQASKTAAAEYLAATETYDAWRADVSESLQKVRDMAGAEDGKLADLSTRQKRVSKLADGNCPTCEQLVNAKSKSSVLKELGNQITLQSQRVTAVQLDVDVAQRELVSKKAPSGKESDAALAQANEARRAMDKVATELRGLQQMTPLLEQQAAEAAERARGGGDELKRADKRIKTAQDSVASKKLDVTAREVELEMANFWVDGFGNKGIKAFLIEAKLPYVNARATMYARRLLGDNCVVRISATTQLSSRPGVSEKLWIEGKIPGCTHTYAGASKGQKNRLNLCLLLALRDAAALRSGLDQVFIDELFDGLDAAGADFVVSLLREVAKTRPVYLVTHNDRLRAAGERVWTVQHNGSETAPESIVVGEGTTHAGPPKFALRSPATPSRVLQKRKAVPA